MTNFKLETISSHLQKSSLCYNIWRFAKTCYPRFSYKTSHKKQKSAPIPYETQSEQDWVQRLLVIRDRLSQPAPIAYTEKEKNVRSPKNLCRPPRVFGRSSTISSRSLRFLGRSLTVLCRSPGSLPEPDLRPKVLQKSANIRHKLSPASAEAPFWLILVNLSSCFDFRFSTKRKK